MVMREEIRSEGYSITMRKTMIRGRGAFTLIYLSFVTRLMLSSSDSEIGLLKRLWTYTMTHSVHYRTWSQGKLP